MRFRAGIFEKKEENDMSRNKKTELIIARLITAVFLFVLVSAPVSVYAAGESASENEAGDEEFETWGDALEDQDYSENLAQSIADYFVSTFLNYVGTGSDIAHDVEEMMGNQYDNTLDLYNNLRNYVLPLSRQTVNNIDPTDLTIQVYGKPVRNKNNLKLVQEYSKTISEENQFQTITDKKKVGDTVTPDVFPSWFHIAMKFPANNLPQYPSGYNSEGLPCVFLNNPTAPKYYFRYDYWYPLPGSYTNVICFINDRFNSPTNWDYGSFYYGSNNLQVNSKRVYYTNYIDFVNMTENTITYWEAANNNNKGGDLYFYGSGYIQYQTYSNGTKVYYWDNDTRTLYFIGTGSATNYFGTTDSNDVIGNYTVNVITSVDFDDFQDLINQMMLDVNIDNNITNSLLLEILTELRNQRDNYVEQDGDDIYNYIDYIMEKLIEVKDIHIEIPDISPDLGGIADALTALLNFLASIIRTIGSLVETLLEGLLHLFVPSQEDWDDINLQFATLTAPFDWIREFIAEAASNISLLLFGSNVTDFEVEETEDVELVRGISGSTVDPDIVYDPNSGAPKIPVRFSNSSSEYFSNIEDAYIIDMSWYAPFKPVGDIIVVAFCWLMFVWRVLHDLPGIINGATGAFDQSPQDYSGYLQKEYAAWKFFGRK